MATTTITALTAVLAANLTDTAVVAVDDSTTATRKATVAQLRAQLLTGYGGASTITTIGTLVAGAVPASLVTPGPFGAGNYTFLDKVMVVNATSTAGALNLPNNQSVAWRNAAGTADYQFFLNGANVFQFYSASGAYVVMDSLGVGVSPPGVTGDVAFSGHLVLGTDPGGTDLLRVGGAATTSGTITAGAYMVAGAGAGFLGTGTFVIGVNGVGTAITIDGTTRASTFAGLLTASGGLKLGSAYAAGAPAATGYVTLQDSTGTTYKVLVST